MYDALTTRYTFACPARGETSREAVRLPGGRPAAGRRPPGRVPRPLRLRLRRGVRISINLVTHEHVDLPFHNDAEIGVVQHIFTSDTTQTLDEFRTRLFSSDFDARRLHSNNGPCPWLDAREPPYPESRYSLGMPTYGYRCPKGHEFEAIHRMGAPPPTPAKSAVPLL